jgi:hypothetical protein
VLAGPILRDRNVVQVGGSVTYVIGEGLELHAEGSYRHDQRLPVANLAPLARPADAPPPAAPEFIWQPGGQAHLIQALGGGQYTFGGDSALRGLNVIAEYYYQNEGWTSADWNSYFTGFDIIKSVTSGQGPPPGSLDAGAKLVEFATTNAALMRYRPVYWGRHYGFLRLAKDDVPFPGVELSIFTVAAFPDWSLATGTAAVVNVHNLQVRLSARSYSGGAKTEFGRLPDRYLLQVDVYYVF